MLSRVVGNRVHSQGIKFVLHNYDLSSSHQEVKYVIHNEGTLMFGPNSMVYLLGQ